MNVRGAPLIAIVAALGLGCDMTARLAAGEFPTRSEAARWLKDATEYLRTSRPTAVNLFTAMDQVLALAEMGEVSRCLVCVGGLGDLGPLLPSFLPSGPPTHIYPKPMHTHIFIYVDGQGRGCGAAGLGGGELRGAAAGGGRGDQQGHWGPRRGGHFGAGRQPGVGGWFGGGCLFFFNHKSVYAYIFPYITNAQAVRPRDDALQHRLARHGGVRHGAGGHPLAARECANVFI